MTPTNCYCIHTFIHDYPAGLVLPQRTTNCGGEWSDLALSQADSIHMDSTLVYKDKYRIKFQNPIQKASWTAAQQFYSLNLQQDCCSMSLWCFPDLPTMQMQTAVTKYAIRMPNQVSPEKGERKSKNPASSETISLRRRILIPVCM